MQNRSERGVHTAEHVLRRPVPGLADWEGAHLFLELIRRGSFRSAAEQVGISVNALRTRITAFEKSLGAVLLTRHIDGVRPTPEGERVLAVVREMEKSSLEMLRVAAAADQALTGSVRLSITEGLGAVWVGSRLHDFQEKHPGLMIDIHASMHSADVLRRDADLSVQLKRPTAPDLKVIKLGRLHMMLFASPTYIERHGAPHTMAELFQHRLLIQTAEDEDESTFKLYDRLFAGMPPEKLFAQRSNVSSVHYYAICNGAGIGMLPTYCVMLNAPVMPLQVPLHHQIDIWMTYHDSAVAIPRVRHMADWLIENFSPKTFPWFRDEFIAPEKLKGLYRGKALPDALTDFSRKPLRPPKRSKKQV
jgi:Transcriptional regulator